MSKYLLYLVKDIGKNRKITLSFAKTKEQFFFLKNKPCLVVEATARRDTRLQASAASDVYACCITFYNNGYMYSFGGGMLNYNNLGGVCL